MKAIKKFFNKLLGLDLGLVIADIHDNIHGIEYRVDLIERRVDETCRMIRKLEELERESDDETESQPTA